MGDQQGLLAPKGQGSQRLNGYGYTRPPDGGGVVRLRYSLLPSEKDVSGF